MRKYQIVREWNDEGEECSPIVLGIVTPTNHFQNSDEPFSDSVFLQDIFYRWQQFKATEPDCDSEFIQFLSPWYQEVEPDFVTMVVS